MRALRQYHPLVRLGSDHPLVPTCHTPRRRAQ